VKRNLQTLRFPWKKLSKLYNGDREKMLEHAANDLLEFSTRPLQNYQRRTVGYRFRNYCLSVRSTGISREAFTKLLELTNDVGVTEKELIHYLKLENKKTDRDEDRI